MQRVYIIGVGDDGVEGLTAAARQVLSQAEVVLGSPAILSRLGLAAKTVELSPKLDEMVQQVAAHVDRRAVLLTTGDPLFYGVARYLCDRLGKERFEVMPHVSTMQLAFARIKESWDDAYLASLSTQPLDRVIQKARLAEKIGLFTTDQVTPKQVAAAFLAQQLDYFTAFVCENLGSPDERVTQADLADIVQLDYAPLNVMVLVRKPFIPDRPAEMSGQRVFGNRDELFLQASPKRGLLTPMEVRVIALAEMDLGPSSIVWDVGAGSGSVAIEAARLAPQGKVYAIEMDPEDHQLMSANAQRFHVGESLVPVLGCAPDAWADLPDPDAIFVGGTGRSVGQIVAMALQRLKPRGRLVANVGSLDNVLSVKEVFRAIPGEAALRMIQVAHGTDQLDRVGLEGMNPTFLLSFVKG
ncbi:MAG: precorrin-6y C5,15-methyltransferase (decarboxylating) subunit CbiE [Planctomycetales bacterium]|nr:precorrin-6y C5,15-methyltransferase (decarboxylating) subunit CbiE [Planctomycetales bacterium]MCA9171264.1 precorrin-6y C5,15-methyltransferase (decarboxylating) subunit CbiE [Planctomycetales bacterium]